MTTEIMTLGKREFTVESRTIPIDDLKYNAENPRFCDDFEKNPETVMNQEQIQSMMFAQEHVGQLKISISCNGGLIEPLIVRDGDLTVLEGNSRLAAFRQLAQEDPEHWKTIPCRVLPKDIDDEAIFVLLGQYHIIGRQDWGPFEQASYLYKRHKQTNVPIRDMAAELGISTKCANKYIKTIEFMVNHDDLNEKHWNCYDKYLKDASIKKIRETETDLDETVAAAVKNEEISKTRDIGMLCETAKVAVDGDNEAQQVINSIATGRMNIYDGHARIENTGKFENVALKLARIKNDISRQGFRNSMTMSADSADELKQEIDSIIEILTDLRIALG